MGKAQIQSQVLVYILAVVIMGMILIFGYQAIYNMKNQACEVQKVRFRTDIQSDIKTIGLDFGTSKLKTYELKCGNYREICFVNLDHTDSYGENDVMSQLNEIVPVVDGIIKDAVSDMINEGSARKNMFLCPTCSEQEFVGNITILDKNGEDTVFRCFTLNKGSLSFRITGKGDMAQIS